MSGRNDSLYNFFTFLLNGMETMTKTTTNTALAVATAAALISGGAAFMMIPSLPSGQDPCPPLPRGASAECRRLYDNCRAFHRPTAGSSVTDAIRADASYKYKKHCLPQLVQTPPTPPTPPPAIPPSFGGLPPGSMNPPPQNCGLNNYTVATTTGSSCPTINSYPSTSVTLTVTCNDGVTFTSSTGCLWGTAQSIQQSSYNNRQDIERNYCQCPGRPDLVIDAIQFARITPAQGDQFYEMQVTVRNAGAGAVNRNVGMELGIQYTNGTTLKKNATSYFTIPFLTGQSTILTYNFTQYDFPNRTLPPVIDIRGNSAVIDTNNWIGESNENNNSFSRTYP